MDPVLPQELRSDYEKSKKYIEYQHNGYLFDLEINKRYVLVASTGTTVRTDKLSKFMIRTSTPGVRMTART